MTGDGAPVLFVNDGHGTFTNQAGGRWLMPPLFGSGNPAIARDFDGDGDGDGDGDLEIAIGSLIASFVASRHIAWNHLRQLASRRGR